MLENLKKNFACCEECFIFTAQTKKTNQNMNESKKEIDNLERRFITNYSKKFLDAIIPLISEDMLTYKQLYILQNCISANNFHSVAEKLNLTSERVRQIFEKSYRVASATCLKMKKNYDVNIIAVQQENELLKKENRLLQGELLKYNTHSDILDKDSVLLKSINDLDISVRLCNILRANDIEILYDALLYTKFDYLRFRNFGKKTLCELEDVLDEYGLKLKNR